MTTIRGTRCPERKRGNPTYVGSSFYLPRKINDRFNRVLLALNQQGDTRDRSDVLAELIEEWVERHEPKTDPLFTVISEPLATATTNWWQQ